VRARPDVRGINHVFTFFATPGPVTCFEGSIACCRGGICASSPRERGGITEHVYWEIDFPDAGQEEWRDFRRFGSNANSPVIDEYEALMKRASNAGCARMSRRLLPLRRCRFKRRRGVGLRATP